MKAILVMFDSLRKDLLSVYGGPIKARNFERLCSHAAVFENCFAGSLPCMPSRRELHTGRYNFLHRSWGPLEPFDNSFPEILSQNGIYTHLSTDHYHYLEDGGATYHSRYSTWNCNRGQEGDAWIADLSIPDLNDAPNQLSPSSASSRMRKIRQKSGWQNMRNRTAIKSEEDYPIYKTFENGLSFIAKNHKYDNWFLQIETFDPHEPFTSPDRFELIYGTEADLSSPDWPQYSRVIEDKATVRKMQNKYYALVTFCDEMLGKVLDQMDEYDLWNDTMLIVNTDHGFLLSEHGEWGKGTCPTYNELVNLPLFVHDPRSSSTGRKKALVQTIDIPATILEYFGIQRPPEMRGKPLRNTVENDEAIHEYALFGYLGGPVGVTDGRYVLLHDPVNKNETVYEYTLVPTHMKKFFSLEELQTAQLYQGFSFTRGCPVLKVKTQINPSFVNQLKRGDELYDLKKDPHQINPINDENTRKRLLDACVRLFDENEAPGELYKYFGLKGDVL